MQTNIYFLKTELAQLKYYSHVASLIVSEETIMARGNLAQD